MDENKNIIETFTEMAPRYEEVVNSELNRFWGWSYSGFVNHFIQMTPVIKTAKILDIATGTGIIPIKLVDEGLALGRVYGLDITLSMLLRAKKKASKNHVSEKIDFVCASAMGMPYVGGFFDLATCALATHHMDVRILLSECHRILREGGMLAIADVGGSRFWKWPGVKFLLRIAAFVYFLIAENPSRAWAEAIAVSNVRSREDWFDLLSSMDYEHIKITKLKSKHYWIPEPLVIQAFKPLVGEKI